MTSTDQTLANVDSAPLYEASLDPLNTSRSDLKPPFAPHKYQLRSEVCAIVLYKINFLLTLTIRMYNTSSICPDLSHSRAF